jgi:hypothetical protein
MSLTLPTWIAAIATVALALGSGIAAFYAKRAFDLQSEELGQLSQARTDQQALTRQQLVVLGLQAQRPARAHR